MSTIVSGDSGGTAVTTTTPPAGSVLQVQSTKLGTVATGTTVMVNDNTIPQNTEGDQFLSLAFTPKSATSTLRFKVLLFMSHTVGTANCVAALFQDSTANALCSGNLMMPTANGGYFVELYYDMTSPGTGTYTFKVRAGGNAAGTLTLNGWASTQYFGGTLYSSITITEVAV